MLKRIIATGLLFSFLANMFPIVSMAAFNQEGFLAPIEDPDASAIRISTAEDLDKIREDLTASYVLTNDIDLSDYGNWEPIGCTRETAFQGKFDGQGYKITGLSVSEEFDNATLLPPNYAVGLFGICRGAQIKNVTVEEAEVSVVTSSGYGYTSSPLGEEKTVFAGAIAGFITEGSVIYNCIASGTVSADAYEEGYSDTVAGGLVGYLDEGIISNCCNFSDVTASNDNAFLAQEAMTGGLIGYVSKEGVIDRSYNAGSVESRTGNYGEAYAGGLVGYSEASSVRVTDCFNEGAIVAVTGGYSGNTFCDNSYAGGIAGRYSGAIQRVYNSGTVYAQANDPYGIDNNEVAYAGGICGILASGAVVSDSAILQASVSAAAGKEIQYRIAYGGTKNNTITIDLMTVGSQNDASLVVTEEAVTEQTLYEQVLQWDFQKTWTMVAEKEYPQLKQMSVEGSLYQDEYTGQHLDFIEGDIYRTILDEHRWAKIYWSQENNFKSNSGEFLYKALDGVITGTLLEFENPYKLILYDYVSDQGVQEEIFEIYKYLVPLEQDKAFVKMRDYLKKYWNDSWGELSDEDIFWLLHYKERTSEEWINSGFENHLEEIVADSRRQDELLSEVLGVCSAALDGVVKAKELYNSAVEWLGGLANYSIHVAAYLSTTEEFKAMLEEVENNIPSRLSNHGLMLKSALGSYIQYNDGEAVALKIYNSYVNGSDEERLMEAITDGIKEHFENWKKATFSSSDLSKINTIKVAADVTWKICEVITSNGDIMDCRELLRANAFFEEAVYGALKEIEGDMKTQQTYESACLFDTAFRFFKEVQIYSMDVCIRFFDTYQCAWIHSIRNLSNNFLNSAIEKVQMDKLFLYKTYCHGTTYFVGGKSITIACPTNVTLYDGENAVLASIVDGKVLSCAEDILAFEADGVKVITVPLEQDYRIAIQATGDGCMDYSVSEFNEKMENIQAVVCTDVPITEDTTYSGEISTELGAEPDKYQLTGDDGTQISTDQKITKDTIIPVENVDFDRDCIGMDVGEELELQPEITPTSATVQSLIWVSGNPEVASVSESGKVTAHTCGTAMITAYSLYGGVSDYFWVAVLSEDQPVQLIKGPEDSSYTAGEEAIPLEVVYVSRETVSCQWFRAENEELKNAEIIAGATDSSYVPATETVETAWYYMCLTYEGGSLQSRAACISVIEPEPIAFGQLGENLNWVLDAGGTLRISGTGAMDPGTESPWRQHSQEITAVCLDPGVTSVEEGFFTDLTKVVKVSLPDSVSVIAEGAFAGCTGLEELYVPFIGLSRCASGDGAVLGAIFGKVGTGGVVQYHTEEGSSLRGYRYGIPAALQRVVVSDAEKVSFGAFSNCSGLKTVILNEGIQSIDKCALYNCVGLTELVIPDSVKTVEEYALNGCNGLKKLTIPFVGTNSEANGTFDAAFGIVFGRGGSDGVLQYTIKQGSSLSGYRYDIPPGLNEVTITQEKEIPVGAFSNCVMLTQVRLNEGVTEIAEYAFYQCTGLEEIEIPEETEEIGAHVFQGCSLTVLCYADSAAHAYCEKEGIPYRLVGFHSHQWKDGVCCLCGKEGIRLESTDGTILISGEMLGDGDRIVLAAYAESGKILSVSMKEWTAGESMSLSLPVEGVSAKLMILNAWWIPQMKSIPIEL